ncbi:MAG: hypothetical protein ACHQJ4_05940 [Ignavibacteria bacterium]
MRIYHRQSNKAIQCPVIYFALDEARALINELNDLLHNPQKNEIRFKGKDKDGNLTKELTIRIYSKDTVETFEEPIKTLIKTGEVPE